MIEPRGHARSCPACRRFGVGALSEVAVGHGVGFFCPSCDGIWLDAPAQVLVLGRPLSSNLEPLSQPDDPLRCPACEAEPGPALRRARRPTSRATAVEVDVCPVCAGAWLDRGELQELRRTATAGASESGAPPQPLASIAAAADKSSAAVDVIELRCPHCGAPSAIADEDCAVSCAHCGSWLVPVRPDDYEVLQLAASVSSEEQLRTIVIHARVARMQLERFGQFGRATNDRQDVEAEQAIERVRIRLVEHLQVGRRRLVYFPYWHFHGIDYLAAQGRPLDGVRREARLTSRRWEHTEPGYDTSTANLRDRGGRLGIAGCRLLTRADVARGFEAAAAVGPRPDRDRRPSYGLTSFENFDETHRRDRSVWARSHLVFKPYWIVRYSLIAPGPPGAEIWWSLVDASLGRVVADLDPGEEAALLRTPSVDPLGSRPETKVRIVASRCPECGRDQLPDRRAWLHVCPNCHEGLETTSRGLARARYSAVPWKGRSAPAGYLPFWRLRVSTADSQRGGAAADAKGGEMPGAEPDETGASGWLWIPAIRMLGTELGDAAFVRLVRWANGAGLRVVEGQIPTVAEVGRLVPASVPASQACELAAAALFVVHERRAPAEARAAIDSTRLSADPALVLVPARFQRNRWQLPGLQGGVPEFVVSGAGASAV